MERWKTAGWVPDSDEEDADLALPDSVQHDSQLAFAPQDISSDEDELAQPAPQAFNRPKQTLEESVKLASSRKLQPSHSFQASNHGSFQHGDGLTEVRVVIGDEAIPPAVEESEHAKLSSSIEKASATAFSLSASRPLDQPPDSPSSVHSSTSSLSSASSQFLKEFESRHRGGGEGTINAVDELSRAMLATESETPLPRGLGLSRSFRRRNPIQLHPYILEAERYKQTMHSRGVKALQIQQEREKAGQAHENNDSDNESDNQGFTSGSQASTVASNEGTQTQQELNAIESQVDPIDEDLLGVDELLKTSSRKLKRPGKRRKLSHPIGILKKVRDENPANRDNSRRKFRHGLPTPRASDGAESPGLLTPQVIIPRRSPTQGFRMPPTIRPVQFETPAKSVDRAAKTPVDLLSSPESPDVIPIASSRRPRRSLSEASDDSSVQVSPSIPTKDRYSSSLKRRTRGVLPASWTTINMKQPPEERKEQKKSQHFTEQQRGVAKPIRGRSGHVSGQRQSGTETVRVFSDDEIASSPPAQNLADVEEQAEPNALEMLADWPDSDHMEDNAIDLMLDSGPSRSKKRKSHLLDRSSRSLKQTRIPKHFQQKKRSQVKRVRRPVRLGILDNNVKTRDAPNFIRVAARTAKSLRGKGRSSPSRKAFKFHDSSDERDVQTVLQEWKEVGAEEHQESPPRSRTALGPVSGNARSNPLSQKKSRGAMKNSSRGSKIQEKLKVPESRRERTVAQMTEALDYAAAKSEIVSSMKSQHRKAGRGGFSSAIVDKASTAPGQLAATDLNAQERPSLRFARTATQPMQVGSREVRTLQPQISAELHEERDTLQSADHSRRIPRKRRPRQMRIPAFRELDTLESEPFNSTTPTSMQESQPAVIFKELERYDISFPLTFGIDSLPTGRQFSDRSFVGSGQFATCLNKERGEDDTLPGTDPQNMGTGSDWTSWNEKTRVKMSEQVDDVKHFVQSPSNQKGDECIPRRFLSPLEDISWYIAHDLSFTDSIDRADFVNFGIEISEHLLESFPLDGTFSMEDDPHVNYPRTYIPFMSRLSLIAHQLEKLSRHMIVPEETRRLSRQHLTRVVKEAVLLMYRVGFPSLRTFLKNREDLAFHQSMDESLHTQLAEDLAILTSIINCHETVFGSIWKILEAKQVFSPKNGPGGPDCVSIGHLERQWSNIFLLLPFFEIDRHGCWSNTLIRNEYSSWPTIKELIRPLLEAYKLGLTRRLTSFNRYCRMLFQRCFHLINYWRWRRCDTMINFLFDFFAQNGLANLRSEEAHGSPLFLEQLEDNLKLTSSGQDVCFHVLLKIIGSGIRAMREAVPEKKVKDLVWRLIPNHGRRHPKDQEVRQEDLDATRNHHDLLCTLFWAAPLASRPNLLKVVRNLIEDEGSHRHAYHINIRAWSNLVRYQIKSDCTHERLQPFSEWASDLLDKLLRQHALAKTEVEAQVHRSETEGGQVIDEATQKRAIESNQRQIEAVIRDLLISLENAVSQCPSEAGSVLIVPNLKRIFDLYDGRQARVDKVVVGALDVITAAIEAKKTPPKTSTTQGNVDSQGFDWSIFENSNDLEPMDSSRCESLLKGPIYAALHGLVSSVFKSECFTSDDLYAAVVRTWANTALAYVKEGLKSWDNYVGLYGNDTWMVLGDTAQKRKYTPFFFSLLLRGDERVFEQHLSTFLGVWLESIVDRDSQLRWQGDLTAQILHRGRNEPILWNLPFSADETGEYSITLDMITRRRLSVLRTVLSNMRLAVSSGECPDGVTRQERLNDYRSLVQQMMIAMKTRYEELGNESETQNAYVKFVHEVLGAMQEHVQDICPIDPFFTGSAAFPLPDNDPTYVSSRLKSYGLRLQEPKTPKQLAMFLQAVIERAVHDGQQEDLVRHLVDTMSGKLEQVKTPSLRAFFFECILPAYVKGTETNQCGWLLLSPLLQVAEEALDKLHLDVDTFNNGSVESVCSIFRTTTQCLLASIHKMSSQSLSEGPSAKILAQSLRVINCTFPQLDYFLSLRSAYVTKSIIAAIIEAIGICSTIRSWLDGPEIQAPVVSEISSSYETGMKHHDTQDMIIREVRKSLQRIKMGANGYLGLKGNTWKQILVGCEASRARRELLRTLDLIDANVGRLPSLKGSIERGISRTP